MLRFLRAGNRDLCESLRAQDFKRHEDMPLQPPSSLPSRRVSYFDRLLVAFNTYASTNQDKVLQLINREPGALSCFTTLQDKAFLTLLDNASSRENSVPEWFLHLENSISKEKNLSYLVTVVAVVNAKPELKHSTFSSDREHRDLISYVTTYLPQEHSFDIPFATVVREQAVTAATPNTEHKELEKVLSRFFRVERVINEVPFLEGRVWNNSKMRKKLSAIKILSGETR